MASQAALPNIPHNPETPDTSIALGLSVNDHDNSTSECPPRATYKPATLYASDQVVVSIDTVVNADLHLSGATMPAKVIIRQEDATTCEFLPS